MTTLPTIHASEADLADAFSRWLEDYNEHPDRYENGYGEPLTYGQSCARRLFELLGAA